MAKLFKILTASIGGGVVLGAAIRLAEKMASNRAELPHGAEQHLLGRMDSLELRLARMDAGSTPAGRSSSPAADPSAPYMIAEDKVAVEAAATMDNAFTSLHSRLNAQQADVDAIRAQLASANLGIAQLNRKDEKLREELRGWVDKHIEQRMTIAEEKLQRSIETAQKNTLDALVEGVQTRVVLRISKLEEEVAGQSAAMADLRECSLSTERSMQKLLEGIDRLVASQSRTETRAREFRSFDPMPRERGHEDEVAKSPSTGTSDRAPRPDPAFESGAGEEKTNFRRWGLFR
jgi:phage shock protein A